MDKLLNIKTLFVDDSPRMQTSNRAAISSASDRQLQVCNLHVRQTYFAVTKTGLYLQCIVLTLSLRFFFLHIEDILLGFLKLRNDDALLKKDT